MLRLGKLYSFVEKSDLINYFNQVPAVPIVIPPPSGNAEEKKASGTNKIKFILCMFCRIRI